ncbi:hypothetical protein [Streptomyces sp. NPDC047014]|uniref:hypothetical protein n=1 Tax=Streptomyces sp. NPDC047014 TaxID=3155736 RepID=UPI0033C7E447
MPLPPRPLAALRGGVVRVAVLAVVCVLLPVGGHALLRGHVPGAVVLGILGAVALPGGLALSRRRLSDIQVLAAFAAAQAAYHLCYVVPGACTGLADPGVLLGGQAVTLLLAARLLGTPEALARHGRPVADRARGLLAALLPLLAAAVPAGHGPEGAPATEVAALRPVHAVRLRPGRAPPVRFSLAS